MLVTPEDLKTELYPEIVTAITRSNTDEVIEQIKAAEDFCKSYLFKYDLKALFGDDMANPVVAPTIVDNNLKKAVKIIAAYWLVRKANPNVSVDLFREDYQLMIGTKSEPGWLFDIKEGNINPNWPYKPDDATTPGIDESVINNGVDWSSNRKRTQRF